MGGAPTETPTPRHGGWDDVCRHIIDHVRDGVIIADAQGYVVRANRQVCELVGCNRHELLGCRTIDIVMHRDRARLANELSRLKEGVEMLTVVTIAGVDKQEVPVELSGRRVCGDDTDQVFFVGILQDLRGRDAEEQCRRRREEQQRNAVVREVHHRIKNHLQGLLGLIDREARRNPEGAYLFRDVSTKVNAIAVVHGLQASRQRDAVNLCDLVSTVATLNEKVRGVAGQVATSVEISEPALIRETECVPIALLMNEAIGNAVKHSPSQHHPVRITVSGDGRRGQATVTIHNVGALPEGFDDSTFSGLTSGLGLIQALLPAKGARYAIRNDGCSGHVVTEITFEPPVIINRASSHESETAARS